ncbi:MAG: transglutaminase [Flavobacteriaceae bacterium]|nr:MAG: transglutaminase [Flavobacteriaceae bacterium]
MKNIFIVLICLGVNTLIAQEIKFGKVSEEEVEVKEHHLENDAAAAILYKKVRVLYDYSVNQGWTVVKNVHYRIKIYNKEGLDWATMQIPLIVSGSDEETVIGIKGFTFNMVNGKLVKEKLAKGGVFKEKVSKYRNKVSITMPEAKEGSVLDIQYKVVSQLYWYMKDYVFQYDIPVDKVEMKLNIPEYFVFRKYTKGYHPIQLKQTNDNRKIDIQYRSELKAGEAITQRRTGTLDFKEIVYKVTVSNLPSMKEEVYSNNMDNYRAAIKFELASTQFPNSAYKNYAQSWEDVAKSIYKYSSFGEELKKTNYFEKEIDQLIAGASSNDEKAALIYDYVKSKMTWDKDYGVGCNEGVRKAFKEATGNVAEINLMLTAMLRYAGLNANPVLVSTRSHGIPLFPTRDGFNYVISAIEIQNDVLLLDATDKDATVNILPERALNWKGRLIRKEGSSSQIQLVPKTISKKMVVVSATLNEDASFTGKFKTQYTNHYAFSYRKGYDPSKEDEYIENVENNFSGLEISEHEVQDYEILSKPVVETCEFFIEDRVELIGDKMYFSPMLFFATEENPFKLENREYPIDFTFPKLRRFAVNITIPDGYKVESMPEKSAIQLPDGLGIFRYNIMLRGNQIQLLASSEIKTVLIAANYYDALKEYYAYMVEKESEKIVLSKI